MIMMIMMMIAAISCYRFKVHNAVQNKIQKPAVVVCCMSSFVFGELETVQQMLSCNGS